MNLRTLSRTTTDLDEAFYAASCFAGNTPERCVTIMYAIAPDNTERYSVEDGRQSPRRDNDTGLDWWPSYVVERCPDEDDARKAEYLARVARSRRRS